MISLIEMHKKLQIIIEIQIFHEVILSPRGASIFEAMGRADEGQNFMQKET